MIALRLKRFFKKTGRNIRYNGNKPVGFDKSKLQCYKCNNTGHFARECTVKVTSEDVQKKEKSQVGLLTHDNG